ncbi:ArsR/SmtB family transcription factor [Streptomyces antimicrobicus]|uniref:Winged helix-turn-helix domain-containing protein n=1 Tax=Streptomyces antimicrobicus TaxID=2883108 RepID=A0ABS8B812_9ACTN|nr:winged helix-turn-helix domain-containing protein [Streptomyces antimicrobicus]MCB5180750.1 winged helix-turn-helix domain-containing protein [Streptomyces antimicrobicus]
MVVLAELAFSAGDLAQVRFAVSPMWEVAPSFRLLASAAAHPVHRAWTDQVRPRVVAAGLDRGWLSELIPPTGYVPDFLNPAPGGPAPTPAAERDAILASPADRVRQDLDHLARHQGALGPRLRTLQADPHTRLAKVAEEIEAYWELALAPYWARIRDVLDADVLHRARVVAEHGVGRLLDDLHASVGWDGTGLRIAGRKQPLTRATAGTGLLLIPSAFTGPGPRTRTTLPDPPQLVYPARGVGSLWTPRPTARTRALAAVLGRSRTLLLTELDSPASTTRLAQRTGLSPAGVSQCLTALRDAGLVSAHRAGRSVLYARTAAAETLLRAASARGSWP